MVSQVQIFATDLDRQAIEMYFYALGNGQWNIARLRARLEDIVSHHSEFQDFEVVHDFSHIGPKVMLLNGRRLERASEMPELVLLAIEDVTAHSARQKTLSRVRRYLPNGTWWTPGDTAMPSRKDDVQQADMLRQRAEAFLRCTGQEIVDMPVQDVQRLVHELQVYQIELEMQNEELHQTQQDLEASRDRYSALYDFAPIGYLTLDRDGVIVEANLTAARMLDTDRGHLIRKGLQTLSCQTPRPRFICTTGRLWQHPPVTRVRSKYGARMAQCSLAVSTAWWTRTGPGRRSIGAPR